jgi:hypothetical protein
MLADAKLNAAKATVAERLFAELEEVREILKNYGPFNTGIGCAVSLHKLGECHQAASDIAAKITARDIA